MPPPPSPPPPASFPFTIAGNFDYPHASTSPPAAARSRSGSSISRALRSLAEERLSLGDNTAAAPRLQHHRSERAARRGTMHRLFGPPRDSDAADNLLRRPSTANPNRPRATPSERYLRRSSARIREARANMESAADLLNSLSDIPINSPFPLTGTSTHTRQRSPIVEVGSERRSTKRRKLEHSAGPTSEYDGFKYGYKGQVVQGRLKMEIVSCDGGEYFDKDLPVGLHSVRNVLKNDSSVYCSESSKCNLLLKHIGDTPFALEKIVIRAPHRGFTAPIQEGLVFVAMSADSLLSSTAGYDLQYSSRSPIMSPTPSSPADDEQLSLQEAIEDPHVWQHSRQGAQEEMEERIENLRLRANRMSRQTWDSSRSSRRIRRHPHVFVPEDHCDYTADDSHSGVIRLSAPTPPPFTVTAETDEEEESDSTEEMPSAAVMADLLRRESLWRGADSDEDEEDTAPRFGRLRRARPIDFSAYNDWHPGQRAQESIRANLRGAPSRIETSEALPEAANLLPPHARFFIAKNKSTLTIKFQPAISGRHVLLKLWSPMHDGNIDIESVQFYGYSGPRFFPAIQPC